MILRRLARPLLASVFITGGIETLRNPQPRVEAAKPLVEKAVDAVEDQLPEQVPTDPATLVKLDAAVKIGAGVALALGRFPRLSAVLLAGSLVPTTVAGHPFWAEQDPKVRAQQQLHFVKNLGLLGGLLLASADTAGKPSLGWRARRAASRFGDQVSELGGTIQDTTGSAVDAVAQTGKRAKDAVTSALPG